MPSKYNNVLLSGVKLDNEDNLGSTTCVVIVTDVAYLIITSLLLYVSLAPLISVEYPDDIAVPPVAVVLVYPDLLHYQV